MNYAILVCFLFVLVLLWLVPQHQVGRWGDVVPPDVRPQLENEFRKTLAQVLGGGAVILGLWFTWTELQATQDRQITDRYSRAIELLGDSAIVVRLGGIYALERLARDSKRDHRTIMEVLSTTLRNQRAWRGTFLSDSMANSVESNYPPLPSDIQAILTVVGRRRWINSERGQYKSINFSALDLRRADLRGANLEHVILDWTRLEHAKLFDTDLDSASLLATRLEYSGLHGAKLRGANLYDVHLEHAIVDSADFRGANLTVAHLTDAYFARTNMAGADLHETDVAGADFSQTDFSGAKLGSVRNMSRTQIEAAIIDRQTVCPDDLREFCVALLKGKSRTQGIPPQVGG